MNFSEHTGITGLRGVRVSNAVTKRKLNRATAAQFSESRSHLVTGTAGR